MTQSFSEGLAQRSIESRERPIFEGYIQRVFPHCWPNPDLDGSRVFSTGAFVGQYHNNKLNCMWQCWLARALLEHTIFGNHSSDGVEHG
jgi:hypothetical protein